MKTFSEICDKIFNFILYAICAGLILLVLYLGYRYDVNVIKQGIKESKEQKP